MGHHHVCALVGCPNSFHALQQACSPTTVFVSPLEARKLFVNACIRTRPPGRKKRGTPYLDNSEHNHWKVIDLCISTEVRNGTECECDVEDHGMGRVAAKSTTGAPQAECKCLLTGLVLNTLRTMAWAAGQGGSLEPMPGQLSCNLGTEFTATVSSGCRCL